MKRLRIAMFLTAAAVTVAACQSAPSHQAKAAEVVAPGGHDAKSEDFAAVAALLDQRCSVCHNKDGAPGAADLNLEPDAAYAMLLRKSTEAPLDIVSPGDPDKSYLIAKLTGNQAKVGGWGETMPVGQGQLPPEELGIIKRWIANGAKP